MGALAYQEEVREELLDGRIIAMSPRPTVNHNMIAFTIARIFGNFLEGKSCIAFSDGVDVFLTENDRVIPDVMIVCDKNKIQKSGIHGTPDLVVEVLSPSTAKVDRGYKKSLYERCGVKEYWIVEPEARSIEVYLLNDGKFILDEVYSVFPEYLTERMTEEEKSKIMYEIKTSLYSDLTVRLEKVFANTF